MTLDLFRDQVPEAYPSVSVVVAACNEAATVENALQSLLGLDYPDYEVIVVNDRSTDGTGEILERIARGDGRLKVLHVERLPAGWLGKTHALFTGACSARGERILFTDADVIFEPTALRWAIHALEQLEVDHLVLGPRLLAENFAEKIFVGFFALAFALRYPPERVFSKNRRHYVGVGAFNLVRRSTYEAVGGHRSISLQVADDLCLGQRVKQSGYRQGFLESRRGEVRVRWVHGLSGIVKGLEKNAYAGLHYSMSETLASTTVILAVSLGPLASLLLGDWIWGLAGLSAMLAASNLIAPGLGTPRWCGLFFPLAGLIFCYVVLRSAWLTERQRGLYWRGTFYSLDELRSQDILDKS